MRLLNGIYLIKKTYTKNLIILNNKNKITQILKKYPSCLQWYKDILKTNTIIKNIKFISAVSRKDCDFNIVTLDGTFEFRKKFYKRAIQFEGISVVIIPLVKYKDRFKAIVVKQFRAPLGKATFEFPSGNVKNGAFKKQAQIELQEELGIFVNTDKLIKINKKPIYMLPANNYSKSIFYYTIINKKKITDIEKKSLGVMSEGEFIRAKVVDIKNLENKSNTSSIIIGIQLLKKIFPKIC